MDVIIGDKECRRCLTAIFEEKAVKCMNCVEEEAGKPLTTTPAVR